MLPRPSRVTATGKSSRVLLPAIKALGVAFPREPGAKTMTLFPRPLATYRGFATTRGVTVTLTVAESPALAAATMAVPGVAPAAKVVAVVPVPAVCPLVGSSGGVPATPLGGVVVTAHVTAAPPREIGRAAWR